MYVDKELKPVRVRLGISDGQNTELIEGNLEQGSQLVTSVTVPNETRPAPSMFPGFGQPQRGTFPGGGFGAPSGQRGGGQPGGQRAR
jgi:hypothetical protein